MSSHRRRPIVKRWKHTIFWLSRGALERAGRDQRGGGRGQGNRLLSLVLPHPIRLQACYSTCTCTLLTAYSFRDSDIISRCPLFVKLDSRPWFPHPSHPVAQIQAKQLPHVGCMKRRIRHSFKDRSVRKRLPVSSSQLEEAAYQYDGAQHQESRENVLPTRQRGVRAKQRGDVNKVDAYGHSTCTRKWCSRNTTHNGRKNTETFVLCQLVNMAIFARDKRKIKSAATTQTNTAAPALKVCPHHSHLYFECSRHGIYPAHS